MKYPKKKKGFFVVYANKINCFCPLQIQIFISKKLKYEKNGGDYTSSQIRHLMFIFCHYAICNRRILHLLFFDDAAALKHVDLMFYWRAFFSSKFFGTIFLAVLSRLPFNFDQPPPRHPSHSLCVWGCRHKKGFIKIMYPPPCLTTGLV